jgi:hypothetical protein
MSKQTKLDSNSTELANEAQSCSKAENAAPTVKICDKVTISATTSKSSPVVCTEIVAPALKPTNEYRPLVSLENSMPDDSASIEKHPRAHYVAEFNNSIKKTALANLEMCRTVYEFL